MVLILLIQACSKPEVPTSSSIAFAIDGFNRDTIHLYQLDPLGYQRLHTQELILDEFGAGKLETTFPDKTFVSVQIGDHVFTMLNTYGADIMIKGEADDLESTLKVSGDGFLPWTYLLAKKTVLDNYNKLDGRYFFQLDSMDFLARISALDEAIGSLNAWLATQGIDPELESMLVLESHQISKAYLLNYALVKGYPASGYTVDIPYDRRLFKSYSRDYGMVLGFNYEHQIAGSIWEKNSDSNKDSVDNVFPIILSKAVDTLGIPEFAKDFYLAKMLLSYFGTNLSGPAVEEVYAQWQTQYPESDFKDIVAEAYQNMSSLAPGEPAPLILGIDAEGQDFSTEQLRDQVIYIDVWATWCSSCVEKIPKMYALQEEFADQSQIRFLFVSIDKDLDRWRNYLSELPTEALHINAGNTGLYQDYMLGGIPHYILIDASGNIYKSNAPAPDSPEIKGILKELIKEAS
jgi:thiol-disulfide isomerase/thioredoxin